MSRNLIIVTDVTPGWFCSGTHIFSTCGISIRKHSSSISANMVMFRRFSVASVLIDRGIMFYALSTL